jgi:hypothetical protein
VTTPHQSADQAFGNVPDLSALVGVGAFQVGDATQNWGQNVTKDFVHTLIGAPVSGFTGSVSDISSAISMVEGFLLKLPLESLQMIEAMLPDWVVGAFDTIENAVSTIMSVLKLDPLAWLVTMVTQIIDIFTGAEVTPVNEAVQGVKDWVVAQGNSLANLADNLWTGLKQVGGSGKSAADVGNAAAETATKADQAATIGELNSAVLAVRNNKSIMSGIDETEESNFLLTDLFSGGSDPAGIISATASSVPVAYWRAEQDAKKGFISWNAKGFTDVTAIYI